MTAPIAYATTNEDGDITMLWLPDQLDEARTYCAEGEEPIALGRLMKPLTKQQIDAALAAWFCVEASMEERMRAAINAAHGIEP